MDPRLGTRGSNDLGGAMFKGEHVRVLTFKLLTHFNGSSTFLIRQKGEKESKSVKIKLKNKQSLHQITRQGQDASYIKGALLFATIRL